MAETMLSWVTWLGYGETRMHTFPGCLVHTDRPLLKLTQQTYWWKIVILLNWSSQLQQPGICFIRNKGIGCVGLNCAGLIIHLCLFQFPWVKKNITTMTLHMPINVEHTNYLFLHSSVRGRGRELQKNNEYPFGQLSRVELSGRKTQLTI